MTMRTLIRPLLLVLPLLAMVGCHTFEINTAPGLVALDDQEHYEYRAIAPEGVVVGVKVVDIGQKGDLAFWARAATLRIRQLDGYAMLGVGDVKTSDGTPGQELRFGHDEGGK